MKVKSPNKIELTKVISFLNAQLRAKVDWSMDKEYPIAFSGFNINNIKFIEEEGKILSHALLKYLMIKTPAGIFKTAIIGSVVTDKEHQKKGLAKKLVQELIAKATADNCDICLLWSDLDKFYTSLGFELAGSEELLTINKPSTPIATDPNLRFSDNPKINAEPIQKLFSKHLVGSLRSNKEIESYLKIPKSNIYSLWSNSNELLAYAIQGRGVDLNNVIHEWGGGVNHLTQLFSHILKTQNKIEVITSSTAINLAKNLKEKLNATQTTRTLGYIKILNFQSIHSKILRWARVQGEYHLQTFNQGNDIFIRYKSKNYQLPDAQALTRLVWGPINPDILNNIDDELKASLLAVFPLPLWVWGWDIA